MRAMDRGLLALYSLIFGLVSLFILFLSISGNIPYYLQHAFRSDDQRLVIGTIAVAIFIVSIRLFFSTFSSRKSDNALVEDGALGQVRITLSAVENLVKKVAFQVVGVKEAKPKLILTKNGTKLLIKIAVTPDIPIPQASQELQTKIKEELENIAGIEINDIRILVENISGDARARVE